MAHAARHGGRVLVDQLVIHGADHAFRYLEYAVVAGVVIFAAYLVYRWISVAKVAPRADDSSR